MTKKEKSNQDPFEQKFKEIIKSVIKEEDYLTKEDFSKVFKELSLVILEELDPVISKHVKQHLIFLAKKIIQEFEEKIENKK